MTEFAFTSATDLANKLRAGNVGSLELTDYFIDRIERHDAGINAVVVRDFERARAAARAADQLRAADRGRLHGLPMTIKESYNIEGLPTTWGIPRFKDNIAARDAEMVRRYKQAGALFMGKTNVPINLADFQSYNDIYDTTNNPWNLNCTPGGSSGGSAAALAAGLTGLESGSDIGGSIRNPAHFCGVYGHKPTWRTVPPQGHALPPGVAEPDISVCGPLARSAQDLALAMDIIAGPSPLNAAGWRLELPRPRARSLADLRVAVWVTDELAPVSQEVQQRALDVGAALAALGTTVSYSARPDIDMQAAHVAYLTLMHAIMSAGLDKDAYEKAQRYAEAFEDSDLSDRAVMSRAMVLGYRQWLRVNNRREKLRYQWQAFFADWDILICPQMATDAFAHDHSPMNARVLEVDGVEQNYFQQIFWSGLITAPYLPSTVFPTGLSQRGLPIGLQAVGAEYNDYLTIDFARMLAAEIGTFQAPEGYD